MSRQVNLRITGSILPEDYEKVIAKIAAIVGKYDLQLEENI